MYPRKRKNTLYCLNTRFPNVEQRPPIGNVSGLPDGDPLDGDPPGGGGGPPGGGGGPPGGGGGPPGGGGGPPGGGGGPPGGGGGPPGGRGPQPQGPQGPLQFLDDEIICFIHEVMGESFASNRVMKIVFRWMRRNRLGGRDKINEAQYFSLLKYIEEEYGYERVVLCYCCGRRMANSNAKCRNAGCGRFRQRINRVKQHKRVILDSSQLRKHLEAVITKNFEALLQSHHTTHTNPHIMQDLCSSRKVRDHMETLQHFNNRRIILPLILYTDGFVFKGLQRGTSWPVLLQFATLPSGKRQRFVNMVMPFLISSGADPPPFVWRIIAYQLAAFCRRLRRNPLAIPSQYGDFDVTVTIGFASMDLKAATQVYQMSGWAGFFGCPRCLLRGVHVPRKGLRWPTGSQAPSRTEFNRPGGVLYDSRRRSNGFTGTSPMVSLVPPTRLLPDPLHYLAEGILKDVYKGSMEGSGRDGLHLTPFGKVCLSLFSSSIHSSKNLRVVVLGHTEFSGATASEREAIFCHQYACTMFTPDSLTSPYACSMPLFLAIFVRYLQSHVMSNAAIGLLEGLLTCYLETHRSFYGLHFDTMKHHQLEHFLHLMSDYGCPFACSTSSGEAANRLMKMLAPSQSTRGFQKQSFLRSLQKHVIELEMERRCHGGSVVCLHYTESVKNSAMDRSMKQRIALANDQFYSNLDRKEIIDMSPAELASQRILNASAPSYTTYLNRLGIGHFVYSNSTYRNSSETQRNKVLVSTPMGPRVAKVILFGIDPQTLLSVVSVHVYPTMNPFDRLLRDIRRISAFRGDGHEVWVRQSIQLIEQLSRMNDIYYEYLKVPVLHVLHATQIIAPLSTLSANGRHFAFGMADRTPSRQYVPKRRTVVEDKMLQATKFMRSSCNSDRKMKAVPRNQSFPLSHSASSGHQEVLVSPNVNSPYTTGSPCSPSTTVPLPFPVRDIYRGVLTPSQVHYGINPEQGNDRNSFHQEFRDVNGAVYLLSNNPSFTPMPTMVDSSAPEFAAEESVEAEDGTHADLAQDYEGENSDWEHEPEDDLLAMGQFLEEKSGRIQTAEEFKIMTEEVGSKDYDLQAVATKCRQSSGETKDLWRVVLALSVQVQSEKQLSKKLISKLTAYAAVGKPESSKAINCILLSECVKVPGSSFISPKSNDFLSGVDMYPLMFVILHNLRKSKLLGDTMKINGMAWKYLLSSIYFKLLGDKSRFQTITYQGSRPRAGMLNVISPGNYLLTEMITNMILHLISKNNDPLRDDYELHIVNTIQEALKESRRCVESNAVPRKGQDKKDLNFFRFLVGDNPVPVPAGALPFVQSENDESKAFVM